jgi:chromosome segregation ATPase
MSTTSGRQGARLHRKSAAALTTEIAALRRQLGALDVAHRRHAGEASAARERIASLEAEDGTLRASLAEAVKEIAELRYEIARDRAWHKMIEERKFAPVTEVIAIEQARRKTQAAIEGMG